jgi:hypothetical protein
MTYKHKKYFSFFDIFTKKRLSFLLVQSILTPLEYGRRPLVATSSILGQMGNQAAQWNNVGYFGNLRPPFFTPNNIPLQAQA